MAQIPSFEVNVTTLPGSGYHVTLRPGDKERAAIAEAAGITALPMLEADLVLKRWRRDGVEVTGELRARAEQPCVVTLEPVFQDIRRETAHDLPARAVCTCRSRTPPGP